MRISANAWLPVRQWTFSILFLTCTFDLHAQYNDYVFRHLSIFEGLSQNSVIAIAQDKKELMWFGTRNGLNRYDGEEFLIYKHDDSDSTSISNNDITSIIVDSGGDLWIGTFYGLNKYIDSTGRFRHFLHDSDDPSTLSDNSITAIAETTKGDIWVGTPNGLNKYNRHTRKFQRFYHDPKNPNSISSSYVTAIFEDSQGGLWVATVNGLNKMADPENGKECFIRYLHQPGDPQSLSDNYVQSIAEDRYGNLWIGTRYGGLNKFSRKINSFKVYKSDLKDPKSISNNDVRCLAFDSIGKLWIGTYAGLNVFDDKGGEFCRFLSDKRTPGSMSKNSVKSILIDVTGALWVGTYYGGINFLNPQNSNFKNYKPRSGLPEINFSVISAIIEGSEGTIYIGTEGGGVNVLNRKTGKFSYIKRNNTGNTISSNNVKSLYLDEEDCLWIGTYNAGLNILNLKTGSIRHYRNDPRDPSSLSDNDVYSIVRQNDSLFWLGTHGGGLNLFNRRSGRMTRFREGMGLSHLTSDLIRIVFKDSNGNLWIGTQFGLNFLSYANMRKGNIQFRHYFYDEERQYGVNISAIFEDSQSRIWVGTTEAGLNLFEPGSGTFSKFRVNNAIPGYKSDAVHGILEDSSCILWISTNQGILKLDPDDSTFTVFNESDGLSGNEFNINSCMKGRDGRMYFGGLRGLTTFHPDSIITNRYVPSVVLTDLKLFGRSVKAGDDSGVLDQTISNVKKITLDYNQAIFTLVFAIPSYINSEKNRYAYRLKGLESHWNITGIGSATYTIQEPGKYFFEVKGANNDDFWNIEPTTLEITVKPPPWDTWWAFLLYGLAVSTALYLLGKVILSRSMFKHELKLERMKLQFFTNISHEFRTPLVLILGPLEQIIATYMGDHKIYKQLLIIERNAHRLLRLVNQLLDFRKFENEHFHLMVAEGNITDFVKEIYLSFKEYAKLHHFNYSFSGSGEIAVWFDRDKMEKVVLNLISNAFKYTPDYGTIAVSVRQVAGFVEITVTDNGKGIASEHLEKIFDMFYEVEDSNTITVNKYNRGTGIGLALVKGIVDLHAGQIDVKSKVGEGSAFTVKLPLGKNHLKEEEIIKDFKNGEDIASYNEKLCLEVELIANSSIDEVPQDAPAILVVEDNAEVRKYIVQIFNNRYNIREAQNGKEGLEQALLTMPDIIISDVMMPVMDGIEFCSRIKSNGRTCHIPFILLTARTSLVFRFEGLEKGADDYINKPFHVKELETKVKNFIDMRKRLKERVVSSSVVHPSEVTVTSIDEKLLEKALTIVDRNISNELFDIATFCEELGVSRSMLFTKIKAWTNLTPNEFVQVMRLKRAAQLLEQNKFNVAEVGFKVGFRNPKYFSKCFQRYYSVTPTAYVKRFSCLAQTSPGDIEIR